jgi:DNA-binding transcriptional ArsR family regulator
VSLWMNEIRTCPFRPRVSGNLPFVITNPNPDGLAALGHPTRRAIFECLAERPRAVGDLADSLPVSRPAVSQHLRVLKDAGLVTDNASGTRRIYRLNPEGLAAMRDQLDTYWNRALDGYVLAVDQAREERP